jgi:hypothetical protein
VDIDFDFRYGRAYLEPYNTGEPAGLSVLHLHHQVIRLDYRGIPKAQCKGNEFGDSGAAALKSLRFARVLEYLHLGLGDNQSGPLGVLELVVLGRSPVLQVLHLELEHNDIGHDGAGILSTLARKHDTQQSPVLHTLIWGCKDNRIGDTGALRLAGLPVGVSESLHTLHLNLECNPTTYLFGYRTSSIVPTSINLQNIKVILTPISNNGV